MHSAHPRLGEQGTDGVHESAGPADEGLPFGEVGDRLEDVPADPTARTAPDLGRGVAGAHRDDGDPGDLGQLVEFGAEDDVVGGRGAVEEDDVDRLGRIAGEQRTDHRHDRGDPRPRGDEEVAAGGMEARAEEAVRPVDMESVTDPEPVVEVGRDRTRLSFDGDRQRVRAERRRGDRVAAVESELGHVHREVLAGFEVGPVQPRCPQLNRDDVAGVRGDGSADDETGDPLVRVAELVSVAELARVAESVRAAGSGSGGRECRHSEPRPARRFRCDERERRPHVPHRPHTLSLWAFSRSMYHVQNSSRCASVGA